MYRRYLGISALALAGVLVLADNAMAQRRFGGYYDGGYYGGRGLYDGGYYGGRGLYGGRGWGWDGGRSYGSPMYDGSNVNYGSSDGYYDDGWNGGRRGRLFGRRGGYAYGSYSYGGGGGCHGCQGYYGSGCSGGYYGAGCSGGSYYGSSSNSSSYGAMATNGGALIELKVPADATVTFDDQPTQQKGEIRDFITPALEANKNFSYTVHVKAQNMDETRKINVNPGQRVTMDFTQPESSAAQRLSPEQAPTPGRRERAPARQPAYGATELGAPPRPLAGEGNAPQANAEVHEEQFLSFSNGTLEMTDPEHGKHTHHVTPDTKVFIDGQPAKAEDLKADMKIKVTNKKGDQQTITRIDAQSKGKNEAQPRSNNAAQPKEAPPPQP
jgi:uncharacterized protein (TIGR03000 family)